MRYNRTKASRLTYAVSMFLYVVGWPLWLKFMTISPIEKYDTHTPWTAHKQVEFVHSALSPFGSHEMCDQCIGAPIAVRFPVSVHLSNFTDMDAAAYVTLYSAPSWDSQWVQASYPSMLNSVHTHNQTLDLCKVPQQESQAPSLEPTPRPSVFKTPSPSHTPKPSTKGQAAQGDADWAHDAATDESAAARRLDAYAPVGDIPKKSASGKLIDDYANDDFAEAELDCCFGSPGQVYIVACLSTDWGGVTNSGDGASRIGKADKGPPFDDRCTAVVGVCGTSCGASLRSPQEHCEAGVIPQRFLVSDYCERVHGADPENCPVEGALDDVVDDYGQMLQDREAKQSKYFHMPWAHGPTAQWYAMADIIKDEPGWHWSFLVMMFMAFTSTVLAYTPGIGRCGSSRARLPILHTLNSQGAIKDGAECVSFSISASEHKLWVLRNMVGKVASSFYHPQALLTDFFMDETSRAGAYAAWDALSRFVDKDETAQVDMVGFLKAWAARLRDPAELLQETEDRFKTRSGSKKLLSQIEIVVDPFHNIGSLAVKYGLTEDDLSELRYAYELYELINVLGDKRVWTGWDVRHRDDERPSVSEPGMRLYTWEEDERREAAATHAQLDAAARRNPALPAASGPLSGPQLHDGRSFDSVGVPGEEETKDGLIQMRTSDDKDKYTSISRPASTARTLSTAKGSSARKDDELVKTHMSGFRDWHGQGAFSVFIVQWAQSLREHGIKTNPFDEKVLGFCKDDPTNSQVAEELCLFKDGKLGDGGRFKKAYEADKKGKLAKLQDFVDIKDGRISFFFGTYVSRPLRMVFANRGKPEQREKEQVKCRQIVPGVYACLNGSTALPPLDPESYYDHTTPSPYPPPYAGRISDWEAYRRCYGLVKRSLGTRFFNGEHTQVFELVKLSEDMQKIAPQLQAKFPARNKTLDSDDRIELPACWLDPQQRCRGKAGGMNFSVRILEDRENLELSIGYKSAPPNLKLFAIFDCRHMVTPGFWEQTILHFFRDTGGSVKRLESVMYCQVPQNFVGIELATDYLDMQNEYLFRYVNCIRDGVGAVTSCGTNCVWALETGFEYEERTMIEDTATSHKVLLSGYEGCYHYEKLIFGTPKENHDYLAAVFRWSRGAVQLFWLSFFGGSQGKSGPFTFWLVLVCTIGYLGLFTFGMQLCAHDMWLVFTLYGVFFVSTATAFWFLTTGEFGRFLRYLVLLDNTTYFYGTIPAYFWALVLPTYMCMTGSIPFDYYYFILVPGAFFWELLTWLLVKEVKYWSIVEGKRPREISILRSQQMYFVTTPLHSVSTYSGSRSGYRILVKHHDASSWSSFGHGGPGDWVVYWLVFLVAVEVCNILASIVGIGLSGLQDSEKFVPYLVGAFTAALFIALVFDPFCILYFGTTKTITMKHAYFVFWVIMLALGALIMLGLGSDISHTYVNLKGQVKDHT